MAAIVKEVRSRAADEHKAQCTQGIEESVAEAVRRVLPSAINYSTGPLLTKIESSFLVQCGNSVSRIVESER